MPSNIEIKAVLKNRVETETIAVRLSDTPSETIHQQDIFFRSKGARLKLRVFSHDHGELIRYERPDIAGVRCSRYEIASTRDPQILLDILTQTLGVTGVVTKTRTLYLIGQTRIHLDDVQGLGEFLEMEVVLRPDQSEDEGNKIASQLLSDFQIEKEQLIAEAYVDLLARREQA